MTYKPLGPEYVQFYPTLRCDRRCGFCFNEPRPDVEDMPLASFRRMIDRIQAAGVQVNEAGRVLAQEARKAIATSRKQGPVLAAALAKVSAELEADRDVREFYLGVGGGERRSFRQVKLYRRRRRWLS